MTDASPALSYAAKATIDELVGVVQVLVGELDQHRDARIWCWESMRAAPDRLATLNAAMGWNMGEHPWDSGHVCSATVRAVADADCQPTASLHPEDVKPSATDRLPTAQEVLDHADNGGRVEVWVHAHQWWEQAHRASELLSDVLRKVDPDTPQPGLRLVTAEGRA